MFQLPIKQRFPNLTSLGPITTPWGGTTAYEKFHPGVDIANKRGTPINAPVSGRVVDSVGGKQNGDEGFGNSVTIQTPAGDRHKLSHLDQNFVRPGDYIQRGASVGTMGSSGSAYSPSGNDPTHLDYRIFTAYNRYRNPMTYLKYL